MDVELARAEARFEQHPAREERLVLDREQVGGVAQVDRGLERVEARETSVRRVKPIGEKTARKYLARPPVHLRLGQVAEAQGGVLVRAPRKLPKDVHVVLAFGSQEKPRFALAQGAGEGASRCPCVEVDAPAALNRREEVGP